MIQRGQWHHIAGVIDRDSGQLRIYVDGTEQATVAIRTGDIYSNSSPLLLGSSLERSDRFSGRMDEVRIWDTARSETEIQANQNQVLVGNEPGLSGYWRFEETTGLLAANEVAGGDAAQWQGLPDVIQVTSNTNNHLDGVTLDADISLSDDSDFVRVSNGLELNARATIGTYARLQFDGTQTLGGDGEVVISTSNTIARQGITIGESYTTLTIGDEMTVSGGNGTIGRIDYPWYTPSHVNIINRGTIDADTSERTIQVNPDGGTFTNEGTLRSSGGTLDVDGLIDNAGRIESLVGAIDLDGNYKINQAITATGALTLGGQWKNPSTVTMDGATASFSGSYGENSGVILIENGSRSTLDASVFNNTGEIRVTGSAELSLSTDSIIGGTLSVSKGGELLFLGDLKQQSESILNIAIDGVTASEFGRVRADGRAFLNGTLNVTFADDYQEGPVNGFDLVRYAELVTKFDLTNIFNPPLASLATPKYGPSELRLGESVARWASTTGGNWSDADNWTTGTFPDATDVVLFDGSDSTFQILVDVPVTAESVWVASGNTLLFANATGLTLRESLVNEGTVTFRGNNTLTGKLVNEAGGIVRLEGYGTAQFGETIRITDGVSNFGEIEFTASRASWTPNLTLEVGTASLVNEATGTFNVTRGQNGSRTLLGSFENLGTTTLVDTGLIFSGSGNQLHNTGTLNIAGGGLSMTAGTKFRNDGTTDIVAGQELTITEGTLTPASGSVTGDGTTRLSESTLGPGTLSGGWDDPGFRHKPYA